MGQRRRDAHEGDSNFEGPGRSLSPRSGPSPVLSPVHLAKICVLADAPFPRRFCRRIHLKPLLRLEYVILCHDTRFMPHDRNHGPMLGVLHMGAARPTPGVLRNLVVTVGEDVKAGRYGSCFSLFISSEDADPHRPHLANGAPLRGALPMMCLRVMTPLGRENDARGRFTAWPGPDSHAAHRICADATASYASAARPDVARRADEVDMGATPPTDALVMAWGRACFHTLCPRRGRSRSSIPTGRVSEPC